MWHNGLAAVNNSTLQHVCNSVCVCVYIWLVTCLQALTSSNRESAHCCENFIVHRCKEYLISWRIRIGTVGTLLVTLVSNNSFDNYSWPYNIDLRASLEHGNGYKSLDKLYFYVSRHGRNGRIDHFKIRFSVVFYFFLHFRPFHDPISNFSLLPIVDILFIRNWLNPLQI